MAEVPITTPEDVASEAAETPAPVAATVSDKEKPKENVPFVWGTGRRKAAVARVRVRPGEGEFLINKRKVDKFFALDKDRQAARRPLEVCGATNTMDVFVNVRGGGTTGQAGAVLLGVARALAKANADYAPKLKEYNLLSRDPRRVERKKYGQPGARRRFQFSKR